MSLEEEIKNLLPNTAYTFATNAREMLMEACKEGGRCDAAGPNYEEGVSGYMCAANLLQDFQLFAFADSLLREWWNELAIRQRTLNRKLHRATAAHMLSRLFERVGDPGIAFRWSLYTHADDILSEHIDEGGGGKERLWTTFGMSREAYDKLNQLAKICLEEVKQDAHGWVKPIGFAEEIVRRFIANETVYAHELVHLTSGRVFPITEAFLQAHQERVQTVEDTDAKGTTFEELAFYLLSLVPGCIPRLNVRDLDQAFETDIVVRNLHQSTNLSSDLFGRHFLAECKNWGRRVRVAQVGYFLYRMKLTHATFGIIFSETGITGDEQEKAARALIRRSFHEDGSVCIVISKTDIERMIRGEIEFFYLLLEKIEELRFGGKKHQPTKAKPNSPKKARK